MKPITEPVVRTTLQGVIQQMSELMTQFNDHADKEFSASNDLSELSEMLKDIISNIASIIKRNQSNLEKTKTHLEESLIQLQGPETNKPKPILEKIQAFNVSRGYKIGEFKTYHHNYEFSMEIKHQAASNSRILQGKFSKNLSRKIRYYRSEYHFEIEIVGSDYVTDSRKSFVYFYSYADKMYFHFWRDGSSNQEHVYFNNANLNKRPLNEWYKVQIIQSTYDEKSCRQELKINDRHVWQKNLTCPKLKSGVKEIYTYGSGKDESKAQIRNFKFFTKPLSKS